MIKAITRIEAIIAILIFLSGQSWGAVTYYVRPGGNAACNGLYDTDGSSGNCAFAAIDTAWTTAAGVNDDINVYVRGGSEGSPVTYAVGAVIGGADAGNTINFYFDPYIVIKLADASQAYGLRVGETNTSINFYGQATPSWPKTVVLDQGTDAAAGTAINNRQMLYTNQSGTRIRVYDMEVTAAGATTAAKLYYSSAGGVLDIGFIRSYIHHWDTAQPSIAPTGPVLFEACYIKDCDPFKNQQTNGTAQNFIMRNCTVLDESGTNNQSHVFITGSGTNAHTIEATNNLYVSTVAASTLYPAIQGADEEFRSFGGTLNITNNVAWKTTIRATSPRTINNYPYVDPATYAGTDPDNWEALSSVVLLVIDPDAATLPEINATSLLIGRGTANGVTMGINGVNFTSNSIGAWAVPNGVKQYLTATQNRILITGHSYTDNTRGNVTWADYLEDVPAIAAAYSLVGNPGQETACSSEPCWAQFSGSAAYRNAGAYTELAQLQTPEWMIYNGDGNSWRSLGTGWTTTTEVNIIKNTIANVKSLYRDGDIKIIYMGSPPDDATSNLSTRADQIETDVAAWINAQQYVYAGGMLAKFKAAGGADWGTDYFADSVHPNLAGKEYIANWMAPIITSKPHGAYKKRGFMFGF